MMWAKTCVSGGRLPATGKRKQRGATHRLLTEIPPVLCIVPVYSNNTTLFIFTAPNLEISSRWQNQAESEPLLQT